MWNNTHLTEAEQRLSYQAFHRGFNYFTEAVEHDKDALSASIACFLACLEWATPETWPELCKNAHYALNYARQLRSTI